MNISKSLPCTCKNIEREIFNISNAGFNSCDLFLSDIDNFNGDHKKLIKLLNKNKLTINSILLANRRDQNSIEWLNLNMNEMQKVLSTLSRLKVNLLVIRFPQQLEQIKKISQIFKTAGIRIALLSFISRENHFDLSSTLEIVNNINHKNLGIALHAFSALADGRQPSKLREIPGEKVFATFVSDANLPISFKSNYQELGIGSGNLNLEAFIRVLALNGYKNGWSISFNKSAYHKTSENDCKDDYRNLISLLQDVYQNHPALKEPIPGLPERSKLRGIEFIEFAADKNSGVKLATILNSLGFRKERKHKTKAVELFRQGSINILINTEKKGAAAQMFRENGPSVCDIALRVNDAEKTVQRAKQLGISEFFQKVPTNELSIPAISGVAKSVLHFTDEKTNLHRLWEIEFSREADPWTIPPSGLRRVDHISQTLKWEEMESWASFYTTTFEMERTTIFDVSDPKGNIQSLSVTSAEGEVKLNLNGAPNKNTFADDFLNKHSKAGVQHIAFHTDNIFQTSSILEKANFARLTPKPNYYEWVKKKFNLSSEFTNKLKKNQIFYDRSTNGEYFQLYSKPFFSNLFFEVVQRSPHYEGYGANNASFRLQAQIEQIQEIA